MAPTSIQTLDSKLAPAPRRAATDEIGMSWKATAIHSSAPPVRIVGGGRPYRGGYRVDV